jgi:hypothetical protein
MIKPARWFLLSLLACASTNVCQPAPEMGTATLIAPQIENPGEFQNGESLKTVANYSPAELVRAVPELKGLKPAESQEPLASILRQVGENTEALFRNFINTTSREQVFEKRLKDTGAVEASGHEEFRYLALARAGQGALGVDEYRTDSGGKRIDLELTESGFLVTKGFVSMSAHFRPYYQQGSDFRYLGRQTVEHTDTYVVAFAERPRAARIVARADSGQGVANVAFQGVAWIDPATYRIIRLRTDLLVPRPAISLRRLTTQVRFDEVHFSSVQTTLWLPHEVEVTAEWAGKVYRNVHRYSDFRLFTVGVEEVQKPPGTP